MKLSAAGAVRLLLRRSLDYMMTARRAPAHCSSIWETEMSLRYISLVILLFAIGIDAPANAGTHYVVHNGVDSASCNQSAPCATINQAVFNAQPNDTVFCVDGIAAAGALNINKSIDIECSGARASLRDVSTFGASIQINIPVSASDPFRTVRLRGISIFGAQPTSKNISVGIDIVSAALVQLEDVVISDMQQQGIFDHRTGGQTKLFITDSIIRNNGGTGVAIGPQGPSTTVLDNVRSENNAYGIAVASGNSVVVNRSVMSGNTAAGVIGDPGAQIVVNNSTISHNNIGVISNQSVRLSNNDIAFNATAVSGSSGTFGNNRFSGNGTIGTPPAALGGASSDLGQQ
jgi:hypothetical protein